MGLYRFIKSLPYFKLFWCRRTVSLVHNIINQMFVNYVLLPEEPLTIPGKDGDDAPLYLERSIQRVTKKLSEIEKTEQNEEGKE